MSYIQSQPRRRLAKRSQRRSVAMGGFLDNLSVVLGLSSANPMAAWNQALSIANSEAAGAADDQLACVNAANQSPQVQALDTRWYNLAQNWNPTGYYKPADVQTILTTGMVALQQAKVIVLMSPMTTKDAQDLINQATTDIDKVVADSLRFDQAAAAAMASGSAVNAPDLKDWLIQAMLTASNGFVTSAVLQCNATWLDSASHFMDQAEAMAAKIGGIILAAGEAALNVAAGAFDAAAFASKYAMWGVLGVGGYLLYKLLK